MRKTHTYAVTYILRDGSERTVIVGTYSPQEAAEYIAENRPHNEADTRHPITVREAAEKLTFLVRWIAEPA